MQPFVPGNDAMDMGGLLTFRCGEKHVKKTKKLSKWFRAWCGYNMVLRLLRCRPNAVGLSSTCYGHIRGQLQPTPQMCTGHVQVCTITITNQTEVYQHQHQDTHHLRLCFWNTSKSNSLNINQWEHNPSLTSGRVSPLKSGPPNGFPSGLPFAIWCWLGQPYWWNKNKTMPNSQDSQGANAGFHPVLEGLMARLPLGRGLPSCSFARSPAPCLPGPLASGTCLYCRPCSAQVMER